MKELILGTAGHVDHGKTALIEALTGYNGDETPQERERGITIDLSFSHMRRGERTVAFVDVPGHERLVRTMIGGAFGFDAALLLVAADEGMMPQTFEHLEVLSLLGVRRIVGILSRADRADAATLLRRRRELEAWFAGREDLELLALFETSIRDRGSIERLREYLYTLPPRKREEGEYFRCYLDRVFSPKGVGTVVTGTVLSGRVAPGERLLAAETGRTVRVRGIQVHGEERREAAAGERAALRLDLPRGELKEGDLLCSRGYFRGSDRIDVSLRSFGEGGWRHGEELLLCCGAKRVAARLLLYPGGGYGALRLRERVFLRFGDPFVLLRAGRVAGGGEVLIPVNEPIRKREKLPLLEALEHRELTRALAILLKHHRRGVGLIASQQRFALPQEAALRLARGIDGAFLDERGKVLYPAEAVRELERRIRAVYRANPRALLSPASIAQRNRWAGEALGRKVLERLEREGFLRRLEGLWCRADRSPEELIGELEDRVLRELERQGLTPESPADLFDRIDLDRQQGEAILSRLVARGRVRRLARNLCVAEEAVGEAMALMRELAVRHGYLDVRLFKAASGMSRKYCIAYLELLDQSGEVRREGDRRLLGDPAAGPEASEGGMPPRHVP